MNDLAEVFYCSFFFGILRVVWSFTMDSLPYPCKVGVIYLTKKKMGHVLSAQDISCTVSSKNVIGPSLSIINSWLLSMIYDPNYHCSTKFACWTILEHVMLLTTLRMKTHVNYHLLPMWQVFGTWTVSFALNKHKPVDG